MTMIMSINVRY